MLNTSMFIVGGIIFLLYISGLLYMINWANTTQAKDVKFEKKNKNNKTNIFI